MAVENELLALTLGDLNELGFEVWIRKGCGLDRYFPRKFGSISSYFCGGNLAALHLRCIIAHKTLFSPSFQRENTTMGMPHFHGENPEKFHVWCVMAHQQGFMLVYTTHANMLGWARAPQIIKHIDTCRIHRETNVTWCHGLGRSHRGDYAHNMTRICT